jgi:hypothetical protein
MSIFFFIVEIVMLMGTFFRNVPLKRKLSPPFTPQRKTRQVSKTSKPNENPKIKSTSNPFPKAPASMIVLNPFPTFQRKKPSV